jgi:hypothetical protein
VSGVSSETADKIHTIQYEFSKVLTEIRQDPDLSEAGKRRAIQGAYEAAKAAVDKLRGGDAEAINRRQAQLERVLFSVADQRDQVAAAVSYRDAQDRVAALRLEDAVSLMQRALKTGDELLARALFQRAWEHPSEVWSQLVDAYLEAYPQRRKAATELADLLAARGGQHTRIVESMRYGIRPPFELRQRHVPDEDLPDRPDTGGWLHR